jgi:hexosaminidase
MEDAPRYAHRGLMLDCARHFFPADEVKRVIEHISLAKMNVLHWHLSDDQGWRIESERYPMLNETGGEYYTQAEIRDIVNYAALRGVEVVPEIDMPGHTSGILSAYPQFGCAGKKVGLATCGGIYSVILCPGKDATFDFLEGLLTEVSGLFRSGRYHIGGDEAPKSEWQACDDCRRRMSEESIGGFDALQGYFTARVAAMLRKLGKRPVCWDDVLKSPEWPEGIEVQYWVGSDVRNTRRFIGGGGKFVYSNMFELYLDYPCSMQPLRRVYNCRPRIGRSGCADHPAMLGIEACLWTEHISTPEKLQRMLFPRVLAAAEAAWTQERDYDDFIERLAAKTEELSRAGVACTPIEDCNPKGRKRRLDAVGFVANMGNSMTSEARESSLGGGPGIGFTIKFLTKFLRPTDLPFLMKSLDLR